MRPLAIVIAGEPVPAALVARGTFGQMIREAVGETWGGPWAELDGQGSLPDFERFSGLIVSGSSSHVSTREGWIVALEQYLARAVAAQVPVFGICFGHQLLGQALGGLVLRNPRGREIGSVPLEIIARDSLLAEVPPQMAVNMTHLDTIVRLPAGARVLGRSALDENALVYFGERAWGVQFHPEMDGEILNHYVGARAAAMKVEGLDPAAVLAGTQDTPESQALLRRFARSLDPAPSE